MTTVFRQTLIERCKDIINKKIAVIFESLQQAQDALENETKSSAGDKYETSREMIQQDLDRLQKQFAEVDKDRIAMEQIERESSQRREIVGLGSLVQTERALYFVSVSLGGVGCEGKQVYVISPRSPIGALLIGKEIGDIISFGGKEQRIIALY